MIKSQTFPYRFYSHKIKNLTVIGKLFYLNHKVAYFYKTHPENIHKFYFRIKCQTACKLLLKELTYD